MYYIGIDLGGTNIAAGITDETGKIVLSGNAKELMNDDSIKKAYLGE